MNFGVNEPALVEIIKCNFHIFKLYKEIFNNININKLNVEELNKIIDLLVNNSDGILTISDNNTINLVLNETNKDKFIEITNIFKKVSENVDLNIKSFDKLCCRPELIFNNSYTIQFSGCFKI